MTAWTLAWALLPVACAETSQERVQLALEVVGTEAAAPIEALGGVPVTLTRADLASASMLVLRLGRKNYALLRFV